MTSPLSTSSGNIVSGDTGKGSNSLLVAEDDEDRPFSLLVPSDKEEP